MKNMMHSQIEFFIVCLEAQGRQKRWAEHAAAYYNLKAKTQKSTIVNMAFKRMCKESCCDQSVIF